MEDDCLPQSYLAALGYGPKDVLGFTAIDEGVWKTVKKAMEDHPIEYLQPVLTWQEFLDQYGGYVNPPDDGNNGDLMFETDQLEELKRKYSLLRIWTMVECENDDYDPDEAESETNSSSNWWLSPGVHLVNRIGYMVSMKPWDDDTPDVLYD